MSDGYCFGGGKPIEFINVDWVNSPGEMAGIPEWDEELYKKEFATKAYAKSGEPLLVVDMHNARSMIVHFGACSICNHAGMEALDICQACGRWLTLSEANGGWTWKTACVTLTTGFVIKQPMPLFLVSIT